MISNLKRRDKPTILHMQERIKCKFRFSHLRNDKSFPHYLRKMEALQRGREAGESMNIILNTIV